LKDVQDILSLQFLLRRPADLALALEGDDATIHPQALVQFGAFHSLLSIPLTPPIKALLLRVLPNYWLMSIARIFLKLCHKQC